MIVETVAGAARRSRLSQTNTLETPRSLAFSLQLLRGIFILGWLYSGTPFRSNVSETWEYRGLPVGLPLCPGGESWGLCATCVYRVSFLSSQHYKGP